MRSQVDIHDSVILPTVYHCTDFNSLMMLNPDSKDKDILLKIFPHWLMSKLLNGYLLNIDTSRKIYRQLCQEG